MSWAAKQLQEFREREAALRAAAADSARVTFEESVVLDRVADRYAEFVARHTAHINREDNR